MEHSNANAMHDASQPAKIVLYVDRKGEVRALRFHPVVTTPTNGWPTLESLYAAEGFEQGYAVFLEWLAAHAAGKVVDQLPDEWLPKAVVAMRKAASEPERWEPPKREGCTITAPPDKPSKPTKRSRK